MPAPEHAGSDRKSSAWPRAAASAAIFKGADVLLIKRDQGALAGYWSLPGGHIEPGETARAATLREVREETGIEAKLEALVDVHEVILRRSDQTLSAHYLITVFCGTWLAGAPSADGDAADARFVPLGDIDKLPLTDNAAALIRRGWNIVAATAA